MAASTPQKIIHVELNGEVPNLAPDRDYPVFYVVFWWYGIPLGHVEITRLQLPMSASQLKQVAARTIAPVIISHLQEWGLSAPDVGGRLAQHDFAADDVLRQWEEPFAQWRKQRSLPNNTSLSVVICTRDRPEYLAKCLKSLQGLSYQPDEIIVVDNAPKSNSTQKLIAQTPNLKYVLELKPGLSNARNTGIHYSKGEIIAFIDDDVTVHPEWTTLLRFSFNDPDVMVVTGLVIADELETKSQLIFEKYWSFNRGYCSKTYDSQYFKQYGLVGVPTWRFGAGANMAIRRKAIETIGKFEPRLGAGSSGCSEDSEFWYRILAQGWSCRYDPIHCVFHSHRREMTLLRKQIFKYMRGHVTELLIRFEKYQHWGNIIRLVLLPIHFSRVVIIGLLKDKLRLTTFKEEIRGCFSGLRYYFLNK